MTTDHLIERVRAADPARSLPEALPPAFARVTAVRRRRVSRNTAWAGATASMLAVAATLALALPGGRGVDVIAQAAAAIGGPEILHTVTVTTSPDGAVSGKTETWRAPDGDRRSVVTSADGTRTAELSLRDGQSLSWDAVSNTLYRTADTALEDDPLTLLARAREGRPGVTRRDDTTVRGVPVHVVAIAPTTAGSDPVPERVYYLDRETFLPVRIAFGEHITDVLVAEKLPADQAREHLELSPHPSAKKRDYTP